MPGFVPVKQMFKPYYISAPLRVNKISVSIQLLKLRDRGGKDSSGRFKNCGLILKAGQ
jgi:hypothetical protein